jgi:5-bromo-4-chloroindolyl phosphate hydrolysis protein
VQGTVLKAGEYRLIVANSMVTITSEYGKKLSQVPVKVETEDKKFDTTLVTIDTASGKAVISEIRLGGTKTRLVFN